MSSTAEDFDVNDWSGRCFDFGLAAAFTAWSATFIMCVLPCPGVHLRLMKTSFRAVMMVCMLVQNSMEACCDGWGEGLKMT